MNTLDAVVTKITSEPYEMYDKWWVDVEYDCWGAISKTKLMFYSKESALSVKVGYKFIV